MANRIDANDERSITTMVRYLRVAVAALFVAACWDAAGAPKTYSAAPIKARVVDSETGAPVEGVNVVAAWEAKGGMEGGNVMGYVMVMEDVTDAKGEFSFRAWGPKVWLNGAIRNGAPRIVLFKPGYDWKQWWEPKYGLDNAPSGVRLTSSVNGATLKLERLKASDDPSLSIYGLHTPVENIIEMPGCGFRGMPRFLKAVSIFNASLPRNRRSATFALEYEQDRTDPLCGPLNKYVLERG